MILRLYLCTRKCFEHRRSISTPYMRFVISIILLVVYLVEFGLFVCSLKDLLPETTVAMFWEEHTIFLNLIFIRI
jgi:hypothetical protein